MVLLASCEINALAQEKALEVAALKERIAHFMAGLDFIRSVRESTSVSKQNLHSQIGGEYFCSVATLSKESKAGTKGTLLMYCYLSVQGKFNWVWR